MKASEFVAQIQALIAEHGDLEVNHYSFVHQGIHPAKADETRGPGIDELGKRTIVVESFTIVDAH